MKKTKCFSCNLEMPVNRLGHHIKEHGFYNSKEYYNHYVGQTFCLICNKCTKFISPQFGYKEFCGHKCSAINMRKKLREDPIKFEKFRNKVSDNVTNWHATMDLETKTQLKHNIQLGTANSISKMSIEDRKIKFGWMNKLEGQHRIDAIDRILKLSLFKFWEESTDEVKQSVYDKRRKTFDENTINCNHLMEHELKDSDLIIKEFLFNPTKLETALGLRNMEELQKFYLVRKDV